MDHLWTPWRYTYVTNADRDHRPGVAQELSAGPGDKGCVFCNIIAAIEYAEAHGMPREQAEKAALVVHRNENTYVVLNRYPYTSGHVMVVPYAHEGSLEALTPAVSYEIMDVARHLESIMGSVYKPE